MAGFQSYSAVICMTKVLNVRVEDELGAWVDEYAESRGVDKSTILRTAVESFKRDCEGGVPELRAAARAQAALAHDDAAVVGVGDCPKRPGSLGHVWRSHRDDPYRSCSFCGLHGREPAGSGRNEGGGYFRAATGERAELFSHLAARMENGTGRP